MKFLKDKQTRHDFVTYAMCVVAFAIVFFMQSNHMIPRMIAGQLVPITAYIVMAISLNLVVGIAGDLSLGHAGFMSVGAYTGIVTAVALESTVPSDPMRLIISIVVGAIAAAILGFLIGIPVLRLSGEGDERRAVARDIIAPAGENLPSFVLAQTGEARRIQHVAGLLRRLKHRRGMGDKIEKMCYFLLHMFALLLLGKTRNHRNHRVHAVEVLRNDLGRGDGQVELVVQGADELDDIQRGEDAVVDQGRAGVKVYVLNDFREDIQNGVFHGDFSFSSLEWRFSYPSRLIIVFIILLSRLTGTFFFEFSTISDNLPIIKKSIRSFLCFLHKDICPYRKEGCSFPSPCSLFCDVSRRRVFLSVSEPFLCQRKNRGQAPRF